MQQGATLSDVPKLSPDLYGRRGDSVPAECVPGPSGGQDKVLETRYSGFDPGGHEVLGDQRGGQHRGVLKIFTTNFLRQFLISA